MADSQDSGPSIVGNGFIWLLVMAAGTLFLTEELPLQGSRPKSAEPQIHDNRGVQDIEARLWQDPFAAVSKSLEAASKGSAATASAEALLDARFKEMCLALPAANDRHVCPGKDDRGNLVPVDTTELARIRQKALCDKPPADPHLCPPRVDAATIVLAVTIPGGPYVEAAESRRRFRYAVIAGLDVRGYVPADGDHVGYFSALRSTQAPLPKFMPFERFDPRDPDDPKVLVLWLDEDALSNGKQPLKSLSSLAQLIGAAQLKIIGPNASTLLKTMAEEAQCGATPDSRGPPSWPLEFFDYGATVRNISPSWHSGFLSAEALFEDCRLPFYRVTATDDMLARTLAEELQRRDILPMKSEDCQFWQTLCPDRIAIISEWDTIYGQTIPAVMEEALRSLWPSMERIEHYSYLRGLDGQSPDAPPSSDRKDQDTPVQPQAIEKPKTPSSGNAAQDLARADGNSQFDYLRRLAARIKRHDEELRQRGEGRIAAIGVLGSDPYDKLLVLRAMRSTLPEAVFFTTDLDARYFGQDELRATRNLLVASGFGLQLRPTLQGRIPPFRDAYQTAAFLATQLAVARGNANQLSTLLGNTGKARIYEIGRTAAFAFPPEAAHKDPDPAKVEEETCRTDIYKCQHVQPSGDDLYPRVAAKPLARIAAATLFSTFFAIIGFALERFISDFAQYARRDEPLARPRRYRLRVGLGVILAAAASYAIWGSFWAVVIAVAVVPTLAFVLYAAGRAGKRIHAWAAQAFPKSHCQRVWVLPLAAAIIGFAFYIFRDWVAEGVTGRGFAGEPMLWSEGISVWPTISLRAFSALLGAMLILHTLKKLDQNIDEIGTELRISTLRKKIIHDEEEADLKRIPWQRIWNVFMPNLKPLDTGKKGQQSASATDRGKQPVEAFWRTYVYRGRKRARSWRAAACVLIMIVLWTVLSLIYGNPNAPARGQAAHILYILATMADVVVTLFLIFLVADATVFSCQFVRELRKVVSAWPEDSRTEYGKFLGLTGNEVDEWMDMRFVALRTRCIIGLIYLPFFMMALLIASRSTIFDSFTPNPTLIITQLLSLGIVVACVLWLRWEAEQARKDARSRLTGLLLMARGDAARESANSPPESVSAKAPSETQRRPGAIEDLIKRVEELREGAFTPISHQPMVRAILLPLGTYGGTLLLDYLSLASL